MEKKSNKIWGNILLAICGIATILGALWLFYELKDLEENGGTITLPVFFIFIYELLGKYVVSGIIAIMGVQWLYMALEGLFKKKNHQN